MKKFRYVSVSHVWILSVLLSYSFNSMAGSPVSKDCVTCTPEMAAGYPLEGNKSAKLVALVTAQANTEADASFYSYLYMYCSILEDPKNEKEFLKKMIVPMAAKSFGSSPDRYWTEAGCEARYIPDTFSPIPHVIAENTTDRMQFMHYLKKIYVAKNDLATFKKIINSKNTKGQTILDYIHHVWSIKRYIKEEEPALNEFVKYLCDNGAEYSTFKNKKCPAEYMKI